MQHIKRTCVTLGAVILMFSLFTIALAEPIKFTKDNCDLSGGSSQNAKAIAEQMESHINSLGNAQLQQIRPKETPQESPYAVINSVFKVVDENGGTAGAFPVNSPQGQKCLVVLGFLGGPGESDRKGGFAPGQVNAEYECPNGEKQSYTCRTNPQSNQNQKSKGFHAAPAYVIVPSKGDCKKEAEKIDQDLKVKAVEQAKNFLLSLCDYENNLNSCIAAQDPKHFKEGKPIDEAGRIGNDPNKCPTCGKGCKDDKQAKTNNVKCPSKEVCNEETLNIPEGKECKAGATLFDAGGKKNSGEITAKVENRVLTCTASKTTAGKGISCSDTSFKFAVQKCIKNSCS